VPAQELLTLADLGKNLFSPALNRGSDEDRDVLSCVFGGLRHQLVGMAVEITNDAEGESFARSAPFAAVSLLGHTTKL
jgi:hypothetical protein